MLGYPVAVGNRTVGSHEELRDLLRADAQRGPLRRQDLHAADLWIEDMQASPRLRDDVEAVLVELVATEVDPSVLGMITHLGRLVGGLFPETAALRLVDGPPVPEGPGVQAGTIQEDLHIHARRVTDPALLARLDGASGPLDRLRMAIEQRSESVVDVFVGAVTAKVDVPATLAGRVARVVVVAFPEHLKKVAKAAAGLAPEARDRFAEVAVQTKPETKPIIDAAFKR